jgi:hypothetical protein
VGSLPTDEEEESWESWVQGSGQAVITRQWMGEKCRENRSLGGHR